MPTSDSPSSAPCLAPVATATAAAALTALVNQLKNAVSGSSGWSVPGNWSLGHVPASTDALLLDRTFLNPMVDSELAADFTIQTLSFDSGADSFTIQANLSNGPSRYLTFLGGTNALGGPEAIALSPSTTGTINIGGTGQHGGLSFAFGGAPITILVSHATGTLKFDTAASITGSGALTKTGAGTLSLTGAYSYTGPAIVNAGTLSVAKMANGGVASSVGMSSNASANLVLDGGTLLYTGPAVSTDRLFTVGNAGGTIAAEGGVLSFTNTGPIALSGTAPLRTLTLKGFAGSGSMAALLTDSGACKLALVKEGKSTWTLTNANAYTGGTTINGGTLIANHPGYPSERGAFAPGSTVTVNRMGTLLCIGTDALGFYQGYANLVIQGGVVTTDASTGNHTTLQNVVMTGGTITSQSVDHHFFLNGPLRTNADANTAVINCPQFQLGTGWPPVSPTAITVAAGTTSDGIDLRIDSQVYDRALVKNGPGTLQLTNAGNFYDQGTTINGGVISVLSLANGGANSSLGRSANAAASLVLNGGTLQYAGAINGSTDRLFTLGPNNGTLEVTGSGSATFAGNTTGGSSNAIAFSIPNVAQSLTLTGTGVGTLGAILGNNGTGSTALVKSGSGTWILNAANRYTGTTTINGGTLALDNGTNTVVLPAGTVINVVNGTLRFQGATYNAVRIPILTVGSGGKVDAAGSTKNAHTLGPTLLQGGTLTSSTPPDPQWGNFVLDSNATLTASGDVPSLIDAQVLQVGANTAIQVTTGPNGVPSQLTISSLIQNYNSVGANPLRKTGAGTLTLSGASTYTGPTIMAGGIVNTTALANGGSPSNLGASPNTAGGLVLDGGTWRYTGPNVSIDRLFTLGAAGGVIEVANATDLTLANPGAIACSGTAAARTLTLSGSASGTLASQIVDGSGGPTSVAKTGPGTWKLTGASTYTGVTTVRGGVLVTGRPANGGVPSALGAASNAAANLVLDGGELQFMNVGTAATTDRLFSVGPNGARLGASGSAVIFQGNGAGPANAIGFTTPNTPATLTLLYGPGTLVPVLRNNGSGTTSLNKESQGVWTLAGANTYTGTTTVSGGLLIITAPQACPIYVVTGTSPTGASQAMLMAPILVCTLSLGADNVLAGNAAVKVTGNAVFDAGSYRCTITRVTLNGGTITGTTGVVSATGVFDLQYGTASATLGGPAPLVKSTAALVTLTGANTFTGGTQLNDGTLAIGSVSALGTTGSISFAGGTLQFSTANTTDYSARFSYAPGQLYRLDTNARRSRWPRGWPVPAVRSRSSARAR